MFTRQSELAAQTKPLGVLNQVLNTKINLAISEVLEISKELSGLLGDKIKPKSQKPAVLMTTSLLITTSFHMKNWGLLIQLHMQCNRHPITAIIDTSLQLNIINKSVCDSKILWLIDYKKDYGHCRCKQWQSQLIGLVLNIPLNSGDVKTEANLYVSTHALFKLLLGHYQPLWFLLEWWCLVLNSSCKRQRVKGN